MQIFGIRHHGPGSARQLLEALEANPPDILLIEGPPDANVLLPLVADPQLLPPVAILVFNPKNLQQVSFFPFAEFSPEWVAIRFALERKIEVRFFDLPMSHQFLLRQEAAEQFDFSKNDDSDEELLRLDPFSRIAKLAGFSDPERWWETLVERSPVQQIFPAIQNLMTALRDDKLLGGQPESRETLLREAWMRQEIREAQRQNFKKVGVVCGAWHAPALADFQKIKATADAAFLKTLKKVKTEAVWVPWSFDRLSKSSGYAAGVLAPMWYRLLFADRKNSTTYWFAGAAQVLRTNGVDVSPAHLVEAIRLADTLAKLRLTEVPGIEELREAAVATICGGVEKPLELIDSQMVIGEQMGEVPPSAAVAPLKSDLVAEAKTARLEISPKKISLELDLRKEKDLLKSRLLHRLNLLEIGWGDEQAVGGKKQGSFHENWTVVWQPEFEIKLIEQSVWGSTVEDAAGRFSNQKIRETDSLVELTGLMSAVLKADLPQVLPDLMRKLQSVAAISKDVLALAEALLPMARILRYGSARDLNLDFLEKLAEQIVPRVCVQLPAACQNLDDDSADEVLKIVLNFNRAIATLGKTDLENQWLNCLVELSAEPKIAPPLAGLATRFLFDKNLNPPELTATLLRQSLSQAAEPRDGARWLEGFLNGSGLLLVHHPGLWQILDAWLGDLDFEIFRGILPLLRRTFSKFEPAERQKMLDLAKNELSPAAAKSDSESFDEAQVAAVLPFLRLIFQD